MEIVLDPGRCLGKTFGFGSKMSTVVSLHNFGNILDQVRHIGAYTADVCQNIEESLVAAWNPYGIYSYRG